MQTKYYNFTEERLHINIFTTEILENGERSHRIWANHLKQKKEKAKFLIIRSDK